MSVKDKAKQAQEKMSETARAAREKMGDAYDGARDKTAAAYGTAREKAIAAYDSSRSSARNAKAKTGEGIQESPLLALGGGLALGMILGALLPRSEREKKALSDVGTKLNQRAHSAYDAARDAGKSTLEEKGITTSAAENVVRDVVKGLGSAARRSADAATQAVKK
ncbi:DUF883 family protein [Sphingomicrobium lutaoense]|uniref:ElaB/YqjD/DUF883 family membrane-anchored ribosome-binding protein n=1 Tax=Sphingomicrobium lutaoense TaxID=515949 RepID=A0A839YXG3_9SPHN|nr:DUF883 family protein [Sphingomicrobium lutaoense]MBB3763726.1 ElaB/YqjD/DUF883 family membrane-anchored ribosome-binding protein [Sphingomicrobium lutaoense]